MNAEDRELLRELLKTEKDGKEIIVDPPDVAVRLLEETCERTGLSWKQRHVYLVKRGGKWQVTLSIDGFRLIAESTDNYNGQSGPFWTMGPGEPWTDIPPEKAPYAAKVGVYRKGQAEPTWGIAKFADYNANTHIWRKFQSTMIAKCAEMLALRKALPGKLGGLYGTEEMDQADAPKKRSNSVHSEIVIEVEKEDGTPTALSASPEEQFLALIELAKTREALLTVGKEISSSSLGLGAKMRLSKNYNAKKESEGWT